MIQLPVERTVIITLPKVIYVAGPYYNVSKKKIRENVMRAKAVAETLARAGVPFFCPHSHSETIEADQTQQYWYDLDIHFLRTSCNAMLLVEGWEKSNGCGLEIDEARALRYPIFGEHDIELAISWARS